MTQPANPNPTDLQPVLVRLPRELRELLRGRADMEERTQAQVMRRALRHYLDEVPA